VVGGSLQIAWRWCRSGRAGPAEPNLTQIVASDLERSGQFKLVSTSGTQQPISPAQVATALA
jgi:Tol biopolymer transport system component